MLKLFLINLIVPGSDEFFYGNKLPGIIIFALSSQIIMVSLFLWLILDEPQWGIVNLMILYIFNSIRILQTWRPKKWKR